MAKQMDNLSRDSCAALAAGMSYGKYMVMKESGKSPMAREENRTNPPETNGQQKRLFCVRCGKPVPDNTRQRLYCGDECRKLATAERAREKYLKKIGVYGPSVNTCPVCGTAFSTTDRRKTFCSPTCFKAARSERVQKCRENKRAKENAENGI